ncbi:DUF5813 family protein [Salarchaeum sp. JOR-1]|uniref:DUF5813 family protein n=1 Tax=Salarchaeum sp. JOR-1 TaxID=2599399 RepID=UPI0011988D75|nr:DUF5813 family protein [Salarchaeum sp. JOR-1]QDX40568.1 hypothetical protein FQU85_06505 [Salarchaeum sp. JOR-1]
MNVESEFEASERFERGDGVFEVVGSDWEASVVPGEDEYRVRVEVPTLDAVVEGEVGETVSEGWFETFSLRVEDVGGVTYAELTAEPVVVREGGRVTVEAEVEAREGSVADDALAVVNYVEGTWFEGIVPGYEYVAEVQEMREQAHQRAEDTPL